MRRLGVSAVDVDPRCGRGPALFSHRRDAPTDRSWPRVGMDGMEPDQRAVRSELMTALARCASDWPTTEAVGRKARTWNAGGRKFFPASDVAILCRLGCRAFGETRASRPACKVAEVFELTKALVPEDDERPSPWHGSGVQRNKAKSIYGMGPIRSLGQRRSGGHRARPGGRLGAGRGCRARTPLGVTCG